MIAYGWKYRDFDEVSGDPGDCSCYNYKISEAKTACRRRSRTGSNLAFPSRVHREIHRGGGSSIHWMILGKPFLIETTYSQRYIYCYFANIFERSHSETGMSV